MKINIKSTMIFLATLLLSACAVSPDQVKQEQALVSALRDVNKADREVARQTQAVTAATASVVAAKAALTKAQDDQTKARANFEALYGMPAPTTPPQQ